MMARWTPSRLKVSMSLESSPSESQCTVAPRDSISGNVSSLIAATITSRPWARAASSTRKGKRPLPAISPSRFSWLAIGDSLAFSTQRSVSSKRKGTRDACRSSNSILNTLEWQSAGSYLITPRSDASTNRISISTSSPRSCSDFNCSSAWVVFSLEASRTL